MLRLDVIALREASVASLGITLDVVDAVNRLRRTPQIDLRVLSAGEGAPLRGGVSVPGRPLARTRPRDAVIVLGLGCASPGELRARLDAPDVQDAAAWLRLAHRQHALVAASCTGVFVLGAAGLLQGRRCTSTWWLVPSLAEFAPGSRAVPDAMVVEDDGVLTAGAAFAHIDLMLALVARSAGPALTAEVARYLVVEERSSQARFVAPTFLAARDPLAARIEAWVRARLDQPIELDALADEAGVSVRTLSRRIQAATGLPPMRFVQKIRLDAALHRLQTTREPIESIAQQVGFADASALHRLLVRHTGSAAGAFRRRQPLPALQITPRSVKGSRRSTRSKAKGDRSSVR